MTPKSDPITLNDFFDDLRRAPFIRLLLPLLLGIVTELLAFPLFCAAGYLLVSVLLLIIALCFTRWQSAYGKRWVWGLLFFLAFYLVGCGLVQQRKTHCELPLDHAVVFRALVYDNPQERASSIRMEARVQAYSDSTGQWYTCREQVFLYLRNDSATIVPRAGDVLLCKAQFNSIPPPQNPLEFNYRDYLAQRNIFANAFVEGRQVRLLDSNQLAFYRRYPLLLQAATVRPFQLAGLSGDELAVATALTTGDKQYLDNELLQAYSSTGTIHLLAVSGLHVAIIFMVFNFLLAFMNRNNYTRIIKGILIIFLLWLYAAVAGLAPSVIRASFMLSVFSIGEMANKPRNTYNNLAFSAFALCLFNPYCIFDAGFQLSYCAVLGIVYFQPKLQVLLTVRSKWIHQLWSLACVTLSAQLGTLPIILYTFHQFPTYFLFSNMLVVPFTSIVMYFVVAVLAFSWWPMAAGCLGWCLAQLIKLLNGTVVFFEQLPGSLLEGIYIDGLQCALLSASILLLALYWVFHSTILMKSFLLTFIGIFAIRAVHLWQLDRQVEFGTYSVPKASFNYFMQGREGWCLRDTTYADKTFDFNTRNHLIKHGFKSERSLAGFFLSDTLLPNSHKGILLFQGNRIALANQLPEIPHYKGTPLKLDYLLVSSPSTKHPEHLLTCFDPRLVIIDNSLPWWQAQKWMAVAKQRGIAYHYTRESGAFISP